MASWSRFEDLPLWQVARNFNKEIYQLTRQEPFSRDYRFVQQIRAASGSIMDNIAEGFERENNKEFIHFLYFAKGSTGEVRSQLHRAYDVGYMNEVSYICLIEKVMDMSTSIASFIHYLQNSPIAGTRYKNS